MKKYTFLLPFICILLSQAQEVSFGIYFLKDSSLTDSQIAKIDINQLDLQNNAWLSRDEVEFYDYSNHCIYLKGDKSQFFEGYKKYFKLNPVLSNKPFIVVADGKRCFIGSFRNSMISTVPRNPYPYMDEMDIGFFPKDVMHISRAWSDGVDMRDNSCLKDALIALGLYHAGISINLKSVNIVDNSDTATVEYTYEIVNKDQDSLLIIDPDKMGSALFHYYSNGVIFTGVGVKYQSTYKNEFIKSVDWDYSWFIKMPPSASMERTVSIKGYPKIPSGRYSCYFYYSHPNVEKSKRNISGSRIWLGKLVSSTLEIEVK